MATHSSTLAWKIPWTEEPGRPQSMGSLESDTSERLHFHFSLSCIGEGNENPLQCSGLENPRGGGAWWDAIDGDAQSRTWLKQLSSSSRVLPLSYSLQCYCFLGVFWWDRSPREGNDMTTHSSILARKISWTEEPGGNTKSRT